MSFKPHYVNVIVKEIFLFQCQGVTFSDYLDFFNLLLHMRDVEMALSFHTVAGQAIDKGEIFYDCRYFLWLPYIENMGQGIQEWTK